MSGDVKTQHKIYQEMLPRWKKTRAIDAGEEAVHAAGEVLLPKLGTQDEDRYETYKFRARFLPIFHRTIGGMVGTITRKDATRTVEPIEELTKDITASGTSLDEYEKEVITEAAKIGFCGTLVDHVPMDPDLTVAEADAANMRPSFAFYKAESILNWKFDTVNNIRVLVMVVLREAYTEWINDFETEAKFQYRVLRLDKETSQYSQQIYTEEGGVSSEGEATFPLLNNERINHIPFYWHAEPILPPLYDLVLTNIKHYQLKADHNHALHYIGLPTPIFPGVDPNDANKPNAIGPEEIVYISDPQAKPFYLTYGGEGLVSIEKELKELKEDMAYLGAQMLAPNDLINETATKATFRKAGETAGLVTIANDISRTLTEALQFFAEWAGVEDTEDIGTELSTDFDPGSLTSHDLLALVTSWQAGAFAKETLFVNLQKGEIIDGEQTFEDEEELIAKQVPAGSNFLDEEDDDEDEDKDKNKDDGKNDSEDKDEE